MSFDLLLLCGLLCGCACALTLAVVRWLVRQRDTTGSLPPPLVPPEPDPYEIAYLRGGANELVRLLIVNLIERGFLRVMEGKSRGKDRLIHQMRPTLPHNELSDLERCVVQWFSDPGAPEDLFEANGLPTKVEEYCDRYRERLVKEQLLTHPEVRRTALRVAVLGTVLLAGITLLALSAAAAVGGSRWNVLIGVSAIGCFVGLLNGCRLPRASKRGQALVQRLRLAYTPNKHDLAHGKGSNTSATLIAGLLGIGVLAGTPHDAFAELFKKSTSGGGCGGCGSCGADCGGCGGCGGCD